MPTVKFTQYQTKLLLFLSVASFFEGYDFMAFSQVLPALSADMNLTETMTGVMYSVISIGTVLAFFLVRMGDRWGRKKLLTITIGGYTLFTLLSGVAPDPYTFTAAQCCARIFLIAEWGISMVMAAEEFPAQRRGHAIGMIQGFTSLGAIFCAAVTPTLVSMLWGWRTVYLLAVAPLVLIMFARRGLRETEYFAQLSQQGIARRPLWHLLHTEHRSRILLMSVIWGMMYLCSNLALTFWKVFAIGEAGLTESKAGMAIAIAAVVAVPLTMLTGRFIDAFGRRRGGSLVFVVSAMGTLICYQQLSLWPLTLALVLGVYGISAMPIVLNALTTELFPTEIRSDAFAMCNSLFGRIGYVAGPTIVGMLVIPMGGYGPVISLSTISLFICVALILAFVPETNAKSLSD